MAYELGAIYGKKVKEGEASAYISDKILCNGRRGNDGARCVGSS